MKHIMIKRGYLPGGTFGDLFIDGEFICHTVERPWLGNAPNESCIPEGVYTVERYTSPRHGNVFILSGGTVDKFYNSNGQRWGILFHKANLPTQLEGCIAPATRIGVLNGQTAGLSSGRSFEKLSALLDEKNALLITHHKATL